MEESKLFGTANWKTEKHVPVIEVPDKVKKVEIVKVVISVGREIPHPNTTAHHIRWIKLIFWPDGEAFPYEIGKAEFLAHGESTKGTDISTIYTEPYVVFAFRTEKPGKLIAISYCNIHGFWKFEKKIEVE